MSKRPLLLFFTTLLISATTLAAASGRKAAAVLESLIPQGSQASMFFGHTPSGRSCEGMIEKSSAGVFISVTHGASLGLSVNSFGLNEITLQAFADNGSVILLQGSRTSDGKLARAKLFLSTTQQERKLVGVQLFEEQSTWLGLGQNRLKLVSACSMNSSRHFFRF